MKAIMFSVCLGIVISGAALAQKNQSSSSSKPVTVEIKNAQGQNVGTAILAEAVHGVKIRIDIKNFPPGQHSIHIHQNAKCEPPDFSSAGPHFDPDAAAHGGHSHNGMPAGDIPDFSLIVGEDGTSHATVIAPSITLGTDDHSVFSNGGTAIVIHAVAGGTSSGAPPRIACGVITKPE
jgi:Cu-Zn family superoxide dismutase